MCNEISSRQQYTITEIYRNAILRGLVRIDLDAQIVEIRRDK